MKYSRTEVEPNKWNLLKFYWLTQVFGLEYGLKQMEKGEHRTNINYLELGKHIPEALKISREEKLHEEELFGMLNSKRLK